MWKQVGGSWEDMKPAGGEWEESRRWAEITTNSCAQEGGRKWEPRKKWKITTTPKEMD